MAKTRSVYALNEFHDYYLDENGNRARLYNSDAVAQTVKTRLLLIREEWFLDLDAGLPWFDEMLGKYSSIDKVKSFISSQILNTDGVTEIVRLDVVVDRATREFTMAYEYKDEYGNTIPGGI